MKRLIISIFVLVMLIFNVAINAYATSSDELSWYVKRNGKLSPGFPAETEVLDTLNAYYIDKKCDDDNKKIYITFDAGYENGNVSRILDVLHDECVPAAFFILDNIIIKNTDVVRRMIEDGHTVCNHTKRHKNLSSSSKSEIENDLKALEEIYREKTGCEMSKYFRFPEGKYSINALRSVNELGYKTVFWSFGYEDWDNNNQPTREYSIKKILSNTHSGAVFLFHPTSKTNADIMPTLIRAWRDMGYSFGTLDELCRIQ